MKAHSQACDSTTPSYTLDLSGNPDSVWISPNTVREGLCCGLDPNASPPIRCVEFFFTLDEEAQGIKFDLASGAIPPGALGYQINCGPYYQVGENICLNGPGPHRLTFCKPGNNKNTYSITSIAKPKVSNPQVVSDGCRGILVASGFDESTITWNSVPDNSIYNSYLNCTAGCDTVVVTMQPGAPEYIDYEVSGVPLGGCESIILNKITRVYFVNDKLAQIQPQDPVICYGGTNATVSAYGSGGAPPYEYYWSTGETSQSITVGVGTYWVQVKDTTSCPVATDTVTVTAYLSPIVADAGPVVSSCANNPQVALQGSVQEATGGIWTGGNGTYSPDNTTLTATYTPTATEIAGGKVVHTLTTTGNGSCPASTDTTTHYITASPTADAGLDGTVCANRSGIQLAGNVTIATGGSWSGGTGSFSPDNTSLNAIYTPSAEEISAGSVTLTLTTTGNGTCLAVTDQVSFQITPAPVVNAGPDVAVCANNNQVQLAGQVQIATGGVWSGGSGTFNPDRNTLNAVYTPSGSEISAGTVSLTLTSTGNGNCNPVSDDISITITPAPTVDAGPDISVCSNNAVAQLEGAVTIASGAAWSGGSGAFSPGANSLTASYTPTASEITAGSLELTLTSTGNGNCMAVSDRVTIIYTEAPTANAGPDQSICANNNQAQLDASVTIATGGTWSGGAGVFSPNRNVLNPVYVPSQSEIDAGAVVLTITSTGNGNCLAVSDQINIVYTPAPTVDAGPDQTVCANNSSAQLAASVTIAGGGIWSGGAGIFTPGTTDLNPSYQPSADEITTGIVNLSLTTTDNGNCLPVTDQVMINITPAPVVDAGQDVTVCANDPAAVISGAVSVATGGDWSGGTGSFNPGPSSLNVVYTASPAEVSAGEASLTLTSTGNGNCLPVSDQMTIIITPAPEVNAGPDQTVCANNNEVQLNGAVTIATGSIWSGGNGSFNPGPSSPDAVYTPSSGEVTAGQVNLVLTSTGNGNCLPVSDQMTIFITPAPQIDAGPDQTVCANNADVQLAGTVSVASGATWSSSGAGIFSPNPDQLDAVYSPSSFELLAGMVVLKLTSTGNGDCLPVSDFTTITITPAPEVDAGPDLTVCGNNADIRLSGSVSVTGEGVWTGGTGLFSPADTDLHAVYSPSPTEITTGSVSLTLTSTNNGSCIPVSDEVTFTITPAPTADAGPDMDICTNNAEAEITGGVTVAGGGEWSGGEGIYAPGNKELTINYIPSAGEISTGSVQLTLTTTDNGTCLPVSDQMILTITPAPTIDAGADIAVCGSDPDATLSAVTTVATGGLWTGGNGTFSPTSTDLNTIYTPTAEEISVGTVTLTITTTGNGKCTPVSDRLRISIMDPQPQVSAGSDQQVCGDADSVALSGWVKVATGGYWSTNGTGTFFPDTSSLNVYYEPSLDDKAAASINFTLTTTGNEPCPAVSDVMILQFTDIPFIEAGPDQSACSNSVPVLQLEANGSAGRWSGGIGTFAPNDSTLNASYNPDPSEYGTTVKFVITTTSNAACNAEKDSLYVTFIEGPTAVAGPDNDVCADTSYIPLEAIISGASQVQWATSGTGTFSDPAAIIPHYYPSSEDTLNGSVFFRVRTTDNGVCEEASDELEVVIIPAPIIYAGPDRTACADTSYFELSGKIINANSVSWRTEGTGTFSTPGSLSSRYYPSAEDTTAGFANLIIESTDHGICKLVSDTIRLNILPAPVAEAGIDQTICADNPSISLSGTVFHASGGMWQTTGTGIFSPDNGLITTYNISDSDTTSGSTRFYLRTTGTGYCKPVTDTLDLLITPAPVVYAGEDEAICGDRASIPLSGTVYNATGGNWQNTGTGVFSDPGTSLINNYSVSPEDTSSGLVTFWLESTGNGLCNPVTDYKNVLITPAPQINAGPDQHVCVSEDRIFLEGTVAVASEIIWSSSGNGIFENLSNVSAWYYPSSDDKSSGQIEIYALSSGNGDCNPVTDTLSITISPYPIADAGDDIMICADSSYAGLTGSIQFTAEARWRSSGTGFFADKNALTTNYFPSAQDTTEGSVNLILTGLANEVCPATEDTVTVSISPAPLLNLDPSPVVCANNPAIQLEAAYTVVSGVTWTGNGIFSPGNTEDNPVYTPTEAEISAGSALIMAYTTGNGMCKSISREIQVSITEAPVVNAGPDQSICSNNPDFSLAGSVTMASGGTWSGGTGEFSPSANNLSVTYQPSNDDIISGSLEMILTSTGNGNCLAESDTAEIVFTPAPDPDAGEDFQVCANNSEAQLNGTVSFAGGGRWVGSGGSFSPANTELNPVYLPSAGDIKRGFARLILETTGNGNCLPESDTVQVLITPAPTVNAGADGTVCSDTAYFPLTGTVTVAQGGIWSSDGSGNFNNPSDISTLYVSSGEDTARGNVNLILTSTENGNCLPVTDTLLLTINPAPIIFAGTDQNICRSERSIELQGFSTVATEVVWTSSGTGTFFPSADSHEAAYSFGNTDRTTDTLHLIFQSTEQGLCKPVSDSLIITFSEIPTVEAGEAGICADSTGAEFQATFTNSAGVFWTSGGTGTFSPDTLSSLVEYNPSQADVTSERVTIYVTTYGNGTCPPAGDTVFLTITPTPELNPGPDITVCADTAYIDLNATTENTTSLSWRTSGSGSFSPDNTSESVRYNISAADKITGSANLILTAIGHPLCHPVIDTVRLTVTPSPTVNAGTDTTICPSVLSLKITGNVTVATGGSWSGNGTGNFAFPTSSLTNHYIFSKQDKDAGKVSLTLTTTGNGLCKAVSDNRIINIKPEPYVTAGPHQIVCTDADAIAFTGFVRIATGGIWSSSGTGYFTPDSTSSLVHYIPSEKDKIDTLIGIYYTTTGNSVCKAVTDSITLRFVEPPVADAGIDRRLCIQATEVDLAGSVENATGGSWTTKGSGYFTPSKDSLSTNYNISSGDTSLRNIELALTTTGNEGCFRQDSVLISLYPAPHVSLHTIPACDFDTITVIAIPETSNAKADSGITWYKNGVLMADTASSIRTTETGIFSVHYRVGECVVNDTSIINFYPNPVPDNSGAVTFCQESDLKANLDAGTGFRYLWIASGDTGKIYEATQAGVHYVRIFNEHGCSTLDSIYLKDACPPRIFPTSAFTPNGDGLNDHFTVSGKYFSNFSLTIFNRWGEIIFYSEDPKAGWDGNYRNEPMPPGVYPYIVRYNALHEEYTEGEKIISGSVTIVR